MGALKVSRNSFPCQHRANVAGDAAVDPGSAIFTASMV
jgi:hypothetical protein